MLIHSVAFLYPYKPYTHMQLKKPFGDFLGSPLAKIPCSQFRGPEFDPWSGNQTPHAATTDLATTKTWQGKEIFLKKKAWGCEQNHRPPSPRSLSLTSPLAVTLAQQMQTGCSGPNCVLPTPSMTVFGDRVFRRQLRLKEVKSV